MPRPCYPATRTSSETPGSQLASSPVILSLLLRCPCIRTVIPHRLAFSFPQWKFPILLQGTGKVHCSLTFRVSGKPRGGFGSSLFQHHLCPTTAILPWGRTSCEAHTTQVRLGRGAEISSPLSFPLSLGALTVSSYVPSLGW